MRTRAGTRTLDNRLRELDLLSGSVLVLLRASCSLLEQRVAIPVWLVPGISDLARVVETLAENPDSPNTVLRASDAAAGVARQVARGEDLGVPYPRLALAVEGIRLAASDVATLAAVEGGGFEARPRATKAGGREGYELETTLFKSSEPRQENRLCVDLE